MKNIEKIISKQLKAQVKSETKLCTKSILSKEKICDLICGCDLME